MNRRTLGEIKKGYQSSEFDFIYDDEGIFMPDEPGNCYLRWTFKDGPYKDQTHLLKIKFKYGSNVIKMYPRNPPNVTFLTSIWHCNIYKNGAICVDILSEGSSQQSWSPAYGVEAIFQSICCLMGDPNPSSPANAVAGNDKKKKTPEEFQRIAYRYYIEQLKTAHPVVTRLLKSDEYNGPEAKKEESIEKEEEPIEKKEEPKSIEKKEESKNLTDSDFGLG